MLKSPVLLRLLKFSAHVSGLNMHSPASLDDVDLGAGALIFGGVEAIGERVWVEDAASEIFWWESAWSVSVDILRINQVYK